MKKDIKKLVILNLPFVVVGYLGDKIGWLVRTAPADEVGQKIMSDFEFGLLKKRL